MAPAALTPLAMTVLALLNERPMHPYEMYRLLMERREDRVVKLRPGSLYHTVDRLVADELVTAVGTDRAGGRPERTIYRNNPAGRDALRERVRALLAVPVNEHPRLPVALSEAHNLPRAEVVALLAERIRVLEVDLTEVDDLLAAATERTLEAYLLGSHYLREMHVAELGWLRRLLHRLETKELTWPLADRP
ncbi:MAG: PadR family transcriptional regulator [Pseudonocardia sp.]|nr:PadR family transcriptional regulator [Pseudonocardia sp.]